MPSQDLDDSHLLRNNRAYQSKIRGVRLYYYRLHQLRLLRKRLRKRRPNSYCSRQLWRISRRASRSTLTARAPSPQSHACAPHSLLETQLHASTTSLVCPATLCPATLNTRKAWKQQGKDDMAIANTGTKRRHAPRLQCVSQLFDHEGMVIFVFCGHLLRIPFSGIHIRLSAA